MNQNETEPLYVPEWEPLEDRMIVQRIPEETKTPGGIIIPDTAREKPHKGIILAMGEGVTHDEQGNKKRNCKFKIGQLVLFGKYAGTEWEEDGKELLVMRETDMFCVPTGGRLNIDQPLKK